MKTHCKFTLVVAPGSRRPAPLCARRNRELPWWRRRKLYCDHGLLTCDSAIGADLTELFNYLSTGHRPTREYRKLLAPPNSLRAALLKRIEREMRLHSEGSPGHIRFQMKALEDPEITRALYKATAKGVTVDLIVRDSCRLRPGIPGLSESVRVVSIVGRFRQHSRIYYFRNDGNEEYYIGSADCMSRSFTMRVEVLVPVEDTALQSELRQLLDARMADRHSGWAMAADGSYGRGQEPLPFTNRNRPGDPSLRPTQMSRHRGNPRSSQLRSS